MGAARETAQKNRDGATLTPRATGTRQGKGGAILWLTSMSYW
ncbi:MAG: hypothetical protein OJF49_002849 [Ktedonobacterales bacterium]|nr:MAG: hypothetical protein OJF49_002849 [Ktedonobacterales bacterium]